MTSTRCYSSACSVSQTFSCLYYCGTPVLWSSNDVFPSSTYDVLPPSVEGDLKSAFISICSLLNCCSIWVSSRSSTVPPSTSARTSHEVSLVKQLFPWNPFPPKVQHSHSFKARLLKAFFTLRAADALRPGSGLCSCDTRTSFFSFLSIRCRLL